MQTSAWQGQHRAPGVKTDQKCLEISLLQSKILHSGPITTFRPFRRKAQVQRIEPWPCSYSTHPPQLRCSVVFYIYRAHWVNLALFRAGQKQTLKPGCLIPSLSITHTAAWRVKRSSGISALMKAHLLCIQIITELDTELPPRQQGHLPTEGPQTWTSVT